MKTGTRRLLQLIIAASLLTGTVKLVTADPFLFDADGQGTQVRAASYPAFQLGSADALAQAVIQTPPGAMFQPVGSTFQLLFHGQQAFVTGSGDDAYIYEIAVIGSVTERITTTNEGPPSRITYQLSKNQTSDSFVEIYADSPPNADNLSGMGFNDGTLILRGSLVSALPNVGTFCLTDPQPSPPPKMDQFENNDFAGINSVAGAGAIKLNVVVGFLDRRFFPEADTTTAGGRQVQIGDIVTLDISQATPFIAVNPSSHFTNTPNSGNGLPPSPTVQPNLGAVNGSSGPDLESGGTVTFSIAPSPAPTGTPGTTPIPGIPKIVVSTSRTQMREGADAIITFSVNQTHSDLTVFYSIGGNATLGVDYTLTDPNGDPPGVVTILSSQNTALVTLHSIPDTIRESQGEPVKLTLLPGTGYQVPPSTQANKVVVLILDRNS